MIKILVTGSYIVEHFQGKAEVRVLDNLLSGFNNLSQDSKACGDFFIRYRGGEAIRYVKIRCNSVNGGTSQRNDKVRTHLPMVARP